MENFLSKIRRYVGASALEAQVQVSPHFLPEGAVSFAVSLKDLDSMAALVTDDLLPDEVHRSVYQRRIAFIGGRLCAELAMESINVSTEGGVFRCFDGVPKWPPGIVGSITHTEHMAYATIVNSSHIGSLGIESEPVASDDATRSILSFCCTDLEREVWFGSGLDSRMPRFCFRLKKPFTRRFIPV